MHQHDQPRDPANPGKWYTTRWKLALIGFAAVGLLLLVYEHRFHIPFGNLFAAWPIVAVFGLHMLMHGGHGGHGGHGDQRGRGGHGSHGQASPPEPPPETPPETSKDASRDKRP